MVRRLVIFLQICSVFCRIEDINNEQIGDEFVRFFSDYFKFVKFVEITIITIDGISSTIQDFCNQFIPNFDSIQITIQSKVLSHKLDIVPNATFQQFLNNNFIFVYNFTIDKDKIPITTIKSNFDIGDRKLSKMRKLSSDIINAHLILSPSLATIEMFINGSYKITTNKRALHAIIILNHHNDKILPSKLRNILIPLWTKIHILNTILYLSNQIYIYRPFRNFNNSFGIINNSSIHTTN